MKLNEILAPYLELLKHKKQLKNVPPERKLIQLCRLHGNYCSTTNLDHYFFLFFKLQYASTINFPNCDKCQMDKV